MPLTAADIRTYVKDTPDLNILLEGELQSSDELIDLAMKLSMSDINAVPPVTAFSVSSFPNDLIMLYGTLHHLANSEAERQLRNQINYSAQGLNAGIDDKMQQYNSLASYYRSLFDSKVKEYKVFLNTEAAWGVSRSPYSILSEYEFQD